MKKILGFGKEKALVRRLAEMERNVKTPSVFASEG